MVKMTHLDHWSWFTALFCLFNQGVLVWGDCTEANVQIEGGTYTLSNDLEEGSVLRYQCAEGFYASPDLARTCELNGRWQPAPRRSRCRQIECPDPAVLPNCNILPSEPQYFYQNQIKYECYEGYTLHGPEYRTCLLNGKWSGSHPVCRQDSRDPCPDPGVPPGGSRMGSRFDIGEKVTYTCNNNNMILIGSEERVCQEDGHWSGIEPTCYYQHTYDTPLEVSEQFGGGITNTFSNLEADLNVTQGGRVIRLTQSGKLNIYIALDVSSSIKKEDILNAKNAIMTLIRKIASFSVTPNYEVLLFSSKPMEVINILSFFNENKKTQLEWLAESVKRLEDYQIQRKNQAGTNLKAVFVAFEEKMAIIKQRQTDFYDHQHVILLFTDGGYNMGGDPSQTVDSIKSMVLHDQPEDREKYLDIYIFAIGHMIHDRKLRGLTFGAGGNHYFRLQNLQDLQTAFDEIISEEEVVGLCGLHRNYGDMRKTEMKRKKYPWILFLDILLTDGTRKNCLGSLVSRRFILTAAHCFTADRFIERITVTGPKKSRLVVDGNKIHMHPKYNLHAKPDLVREYYDYDVALVELKEDVNITVFLRPICIPCTEETNAALRQTLTCQEQERLLITNNERINFLTRKNLVEKYAYIKHGNNRDGCISKALLADGVTTTVASEVVNENFLCSGGTQPEVDQIACQGDSGGAVFKNHFNRTIQVALVSWGNKIMDSCHVGGTVESDEDSRDFHFNLFKVVPFLKSILGKTGESYAPLVFVD